MQTTILRAFTLLLILLFCSCSNPSDTAQVPDFAPAVSQASKLQKTPVEDLSQPNKGVTQPAETLLQQKVLFRSQESNKTKRSEFVADSFLQTQDSFDEFRMDEIPTTQQSDFSQGLIPDAE